MSDQADRAREAAERWLESTKGRAVFTGELVDSVAALLRSEVARVLRADAPAWLRSVCSACDNGVYEIRPVQRGWIDDAETVPHIEHEPVECEYCGRPMAALGALADQWAPEEPAT